MSLNAAVSAPVALLIGVAFLGGCASTSPENNDAVEGTSASASPAGSEAEMAATSVAESADTYVLRQGDKISIQVFDEPDLTMDQTVSARGYINYSYLGDVQVSGKTPSELEKHITKLLEDGYLVNPSVNVSVVEFRPFFISGQVSKPGSYPYRPGLTLDKAIALAGGLTDRASTRQMFVIRAKGGAGKERISLSDVVNPGDTITIKEGFF